MTPNFKKGFVDGLAAGAVVCAIVAIIVLGVYGLADCIDKNGWWLCLK